MVGDMMKKLKNIEKIGICVSFMLCLMWHSGFSQGGFVFKDYQIGILELESPYPMRKLDFNIQLPKDWELHLKESQASGFLSARAEYGLLFQAEYKGELTFDVTEFSERLFNEVRRRLELVVEYVNDMDYSYNGFYGREYVGEVLFKHERNKFRALIVADASRIVLVVMMYPVGDREVERDMERIYRSIRVGN